MEKMKEKEKEKEERREEKGKEKEKVKEKVSERLLQLHRASLRAPFYRIIMYPILKIHITISPLKL